LRSNASGQGNAGAH
jgi:hypothetical protein